MKQNLAAIRGVRLALDEAGHFQPINEFDRGVMTQRESIRQFANRRLGAGGQSFKGQQSLMPMGLDPMLSSSACLAEMKKVPKLVAKLRQLLIVA